MSSRLLELIAKNANRPGEERDKAYHQGTSDARLSGLEREPFIEQVNAAAPSFEILAAFQTPMQAGANSSAPDPAVVSPAHERRKGIEDQLRAWEMLMQRQHQRLDLRFFEIHENTFCQE